MRVRALLSVSVTTALLAIGSLPASSAGAVRPHDAVTISAHASQQYPEVHEALYIIGTVSPGDATDYVVAQRLVNGAWSDRQGAPVRPYDHSFHIPVRPSEAALYTMRVRSHWGTVVSKTFLFRSLATSDLANLSPVSANGFEHSPSVLVIKGHTYRHSVTADAYANQIDTIEYDLGGHWIKLALVVGVDDRTPSAGAGGNYGVIVDGRTIALGTVARGYPAVVRISVAHGSRLQLQYIDTSGCRCDYRAGFADPHIKR